MVRTKGDSCGRRVVAAKAPRKQVGGGSSSGGSSSSAMTPDKGGVASGGNPVRWWPTPDWQKGVGTFFTKIEKNETSNTNSKPAVQDELTAGCSSSSDHPGVSSKDQVIEELDDQE